MMVWPPLYVKWFRFWFTYEFWVLGAIGFLVWLLTYHLLFPRLFPTFRRLPSSVRLLSFVVVTSIALAVYGPYARRAQAAKDATRRVVVVLIDNTGSMLNERSQSSAGSDNGASDSRHTQSVTVTFDDCRRIVEQKVLPSIRPVDHLLAYRIDPSFSDTLCCLTCYPKSRGCEARLEIGPPTGDLKGSDYFGALSHSRRVLENSRHPAKFLVVIGDLAHQPEGTEFEVAELPEGEKLPDSTLHGVSAFIVTPGTDRCRHRYGMWEEYLWVHGCRTYRFTPVTEALSDDASLLRELPMVVARRYGENHGILSSAP